MLKLLFGYFLFYLFQEVNILLRYFFSLFLSKIVVISINIPLF
jgi:hypothetical protein